MHTTHDINFTVTPLLFRNEYANSGGFVTNGGFKICITKHTKWVTLWGIETSDYWAHCLDNRPRPQALEPALRLDGLA